MPRASKTKGAAHWYATPFSLNEEQKRQLFDNCLGVDFDDKRERKKAEKVILLVERCLGSYFGAVESLDQAPTAASYRDELTSLRKRTHELYNEFAQLSYHMRDLLHKYNYEPFDAAYALAQFIDIASKALTDLESNESRGKPNKKALPAIVNTLYRIFHDYPQKEKNPEAVYDFIKGCLDAASITYPNAVGSLIYNKKTPLADIRYIS